MNRNEMEKIEQSIASRVDELSRSDKPGADDRRDELRLTAARLARNLNQDVGRFLRRCGFRYNKDPK